MTIQTKAIEQYFHLVLFVLLSRTFDSVDNKPYNVTTQMKASEQSVSVVVFVLSTTHRLCSSVLLYHSQEVKVAS